MAGQLNQAFQELSSWHSTLQGICQSGQRLAQPLCRAQILQGTP